MKITFLLSIQFFLKWNFIPNSPRLNVFSLRLNPKIVFYSDFIFFLVFYAFIPYFKNNFDE